METPSGNRTNEYGNSAHLRTAKSSELAAIAAEKTAISNKEISESVERLVQTTERTVEESAKSAASSSKSATWSTVVSGLALIVAIGSLVYSYNDHKGDKEWQNQQLKLLEQILSLIHI